MKNNVANTALFARSHEAGADRSFRHSFNIDEIENDASFARFTASAANTPPKKTRGVDVLKDENENHDDSMDSLLNFVSDYADAITSNDKSSVRKAVPATDNCLNVANASPIHINDSQRYDLTSQSIDRSSGHGSEVNEDTIQSDKSETEEQIRAREEAESEALARQLMAEEAMASFSMSQNYLRENSHNFSTEDLAALEAAIAEEDPNAGLYEEEEDVSDESESQELSYDTLLRLGEQIGDVKSERWAMRAKEVIEKLPIFIYEGPESIKEHNDSTAKCLICQEKYVKGDKLRILPCNHYFHIDCVDQWLAAKDFCPYCRQSIEH